MDSRIRKPFSAPAFSIAILINRSSSLSKTISPEIARDAFITEARSRHSPESMVVVMARSGSLIPDKILNGLPASNRLYRASISLTLAVAPHIR